MRHVVFLVASFFSARAALAGSADKLCGELLPAPLPTGRWAIAPAKCAPRADCAKVASRVLACLTRAGVTPVAPEGVRAALGERALNAVTGGSERSDFSAIGRALEANFLVATEVGDSGAGVVRVVSIEDGSIIAAARIVPDQPGKTTGLSSASAAESLGLLADKLATGYAALDAHKRGNRVAILGFVEHGAISKSNGIGTLVAAELVTRFRRDYALQVVERSRLDAVLKELELGQTGLIDGKSAPKLGKLLEADAIVLGSVNDVGDKIRVNAQLVDVVTGLTLLADAVEIRAQGLVALSSDAIVLRSKGGAVFRSLLIPGWGQIYNRQDIKGYAILGSAIALGATAGTMQIFASLAQASYNRAPVGADFEALAQRYQTFALARTVSLAVLGALWIFNIIDAYANGVTFDSAVSSGGPGLGHNGVFGSF